MSDDDEVAEGPDLIDLELEDPEAPNRLHSYNLPGFDILQDAQHTSSQLPTSYEQGQQPLSPGTPEQAEHSSSYFSKYFPSFSSKGANNGPAKPANSNHFSVTDGLFEVQSELEHGFSYQHPIPSHSSVPIIPESSETRNSIGSSIGHNTPQLSRLPSNLPTIPLSDTISGTLPAIDDISRTKSLNYSDPEENANEAENLHIHHTGTHKSKKYGGSKFSSHFQRGSIRSVPSTESMEPLYQSQMLKTPILSDLSQYDGGTQNSKKVMSQRALIQGQKIGSNNFNVRQLERKTYNHADLLTRQIFSMNMAADELKNYESTVHVLIESQRGWFILGFPFFSSNMLLPTDPAAWTYGSTGRQASGDISCYPLPDTSWEWTWPRWYVDMGYDVDDQGWAYSWRFGSDTWHGSHVWFHSFVRRRHWIRVAHRNIPISESNSKLVPISTHQTAIRVAKPPSIASSLILSNPVRPSSPTSSIHSTVSSIMENTKQDYIPIMRPEIQQYGSKYFVVPPAGRITSSLSSSRRPSIPMSYGSANQQYPISTGMNSPTTLVKSLRAPTSQRSAAPLELTTGSPTPTSSSHLQDAFNKNIRPRNSRRNSALLKHNPTPHSQSDNNSFYNATEANSHMSNQQRNDGPFHIHISQNSSSSQNLTMSDLMNDLDSSRIDRERLEVLSLFISDPSCVQAITSANSSPDHNEYMSILRTFTHLDSKSHLIEHINKTIEVCKTKKQKLKKEKKEISQKIKSKTTKEKGKEYKGNTTSGDILDLKLKKQELMTLKHYSKELKKMKDIIKTLVRRQQYYTDQVDDGDSEDQSDDDDDDDVESVNFNN